MGKRVQFDWNLGVVVLALLFFIFSLCSYFYFYSVGYDNTAITGVPQNITDIREVSFVSSNNIGTTKKIYAKVADSPNERNIGMAYVSNLSDEEGMIFVFDDLTDSPFWMKNCLINLDVIFIDNQGVIIDILHDLPPCLQNSVVCPSYNPKGNYRYVIEVNGGWSIKFGFDIGDTVIL